MITTAKITGYNGQTLEIIPDTVIDRELLQKSVTTVELRLTDGREISALQRKKIFATVRDIAEWSGHDREDLRRYFLQNYCEQQDIPYFSLSDTDCTTARGFIDYLIEFCFTWNVPTLDSMLERTDDIGKYLYMCIEHRKCAVCNAPADIHHVDTVGLGRNRESIIHVGMEAMALCRQHHIEAHKIGQTAFNKQYHVFGIKLTPYLCKVLKLGKRGDIDELLNRDKQLLQLDSVQPYIS